MIKPVKFKVGRGKQEDLPTKYIDGFIWFTTDTGKLYIDAPSELEKFNGYVKTSIQKR